MNNKIISGALCSFLIALLVLPMLSIPFAQIGVVDSTARQSVTAMQGPPVEMRINVFEDESVSSNNTDTNYDGNYAYGGVWVGLEDTDGWARSWLKYDLSHLQNGIGIVSATLNLYSVHEWNDTTGAPIGIYFSSNDTWTEDTITWNNQP
ncbi:MAG: DNRLRE domain-containing protein, partial [Candidatus Thorarchaeota archaeon]|nr:DNRLRE domain-containing protein [Candidatus Thorarchaeota archaeon]